MNQKNLLRIIVAFFVLGAVVLAGAADLFGGEADDGTTTRTADGEVVAVQANGEQAPGILVVEGNEAAGEGSDAEGRSNARTDEVAGPETANPETADPETTGADAGTQEAETPSETVAPAPVDTGNWQPFGQMNIGSFTDGSTRMENGQPGSVRFQCFTSHFNYDDPVVAPNEKGAAHLHMFFGNTLTSHASTFESLSKTGDGTCNGEQLNRTAYWIPALIDRDNNARIAQYSLIYYKAGQMTGQRIAAIPDGLRMIAGASNTGFAPENKARHVWHCGFPGNYPLSYGEGPLIPDCKAGDTVTLTLVFPQCWDGKNLDSDDHRSHMAYPNQSRCPDSHPVIIPEITYNIYWNNSDQNTGGWYLSSDRYGGLNEPGGTTTHGDWFGAWHPDVMEAFVNECNNKGHDCKGSTISPSLRLKSSRNTGVSNGQDIYNPRKSPEKIPVDSIAK